MTANEFSDGFLAYEAGPVLEPNEVAAKLGVLSDWSGGFLAFSAGVSLDGSGNAQPGEAVLDEKLKRRDIATLLGHKVENIPGVQGYLMELNLWRKPADGIAEEVCVEREDGGFFYQQWTLRGNKETVSSSQEMPCYFRKAETFPRGNSIFKKSLSSVEVIVPRDRLHFFLTTGGKP